MDLQFLVRASAAGGGREDDVSNKVMRKERDGWKIDFSGEKPATPLLDTVNYPVHMKNLPIQVSLSNKQISDTFSL